RSPELNSSGDSSTAKRSNRKMAAASERRKLSTAERLVSSSRNQGVNALNGTSWWLCAATREVGELRWIHTSDFVVIGSWNQRIWMSGGVASLSVSQARTSYQPGNRPLKL